MDEENPGQAAFESEPTPAEKVQATLAEVERLAHVTSQQEHSPLETIFFPSRLKDGRLVDVYVSYRPSRLDDGSFEPGLQLVFPDDPSSTEAYEYGPDDTPGRQTTYIAPGQTSALGVDATELMASRFDEVLEGATMLGTKPTLIDED